MLKKEVGDAKNKIGGVDLQMMGGEGRGIGEVPSKKTSDAGNRKGARERELWNSGRGD